MRATHHHSETGSSTACFTSTNVAGLTRLTIAKRGRERKMTRRLRIVTAAASRRAIPQRPQQQTGLLSRHLVDLQSELRLADLPQIDRRERIRLAIQIR